MFVILQSLQNLESPNSSDVTKVISKTLGKSGVAITVTSLTDVLAFGVGASTVSKVELANSQPSASNFKSFSRSLEQFFLAVGQNNFGNKIPFPSPTKVFPASISLYFTGHRSK